MIGRHPTAEPQIALTLFPLPEGEGTGSDLPPPLEGFRNGLFTLFDEPDGDRSLA